MSCVFISTLHAFSDHLYAFQHSIRDIQIHFHLSFRCAEIYLKSSQSKAREMPKQQELKTAFLKPCIHRRESFKMLSKHSLPPLSPKAVIKVTFTAASSDPLPRSDHISLCNFQSVEARSLIPPRTNLSDFYLKKKKKTTQRPTTDSALFP